MKFYHRLSTKLMLALTIFSLMPAIIITLYANYYFNNQLVEQTVNQQKRQVAMLKSHLETLLSMISTDLSFLSQCRPMREYLVLQTALLESAPQQNLPFIKDAQPVALNILERKLKAVEQEFITLTRHRKIYQKISFLDETGQEKLRIDSNGFRSWAVDYGQLQSQSQQAWFKKMMLSGQPTLISPMASLPEQQGKTPLQPIIRYALNTYSPTRKKVGTIIFQIDTQQFFNWLGSAFLVNADGYFLHHPNPNKRWGGEQNLNTSYHLSQEYPTLAKTILATDGISQINQASLYYQHVSIPGSPEQWILIVQANKSDFSKEFFLLISLILAITLLMILIFTLLWSGPMTRALEQLTQVAETFSQGEWVGQPITIKNQGEISRLAQAMENMRTNMIKFFERRL